MLYINVLPLISANLVQSQKLTLRENAVTIWNSCTTIRVADDLRSKSEMAKIRTFVYLLLASAIPQSRKNGVGKLSKIALVAAKECLRTNNSDLAGKILEYEAAIDVFPNEEIDARGGEQNYHSHRIEFCCLRVLLHWKRRRLDLADHCYAAIPDLLLQAEAVACDKVVDLCYEIACECSSASDYSSAKRWLERILLVIDLPRHADSYVGSEVRLNVLHSLGTHQSRCVDHQLTYLAQILLRTRNDHDAFREARDIIETLHREYGSKLSICLLGLEAGLTSAEYEPDLAFVELERIIRTAHLIASAHTTIMHYTTALSSSCYARAAQSLKYYIVYRLIPEGSMDWIETAIISYLNIFSNNDQGQSPRILRALFQDLDDLANALKLAISPRASQAACILIWRMMRSADSAGLQSVALSWCQLGLHPIFASAGEGNTGKLERQLISYHLLCANHKAACQVLDQMSFTQSSNKYSKFLAYCAAVRNRNEKDAQSHLNTIVNMHGENEQLLLACVGESIQQNRRFDVVRLLQRVLDNRLQEPNSAIDQEALLKYTCQMLIDISTHQNYKDIPQHEILARLCTIFKSVCKLQRRMSADALDLQCTQKKLDYMWFHEKSFNIGGNMAKIWPRRFIIDLLQYSNRLCQVEDEELAGTTLSNKQKQRQRDSTYIEIALYAAEARQMGPSYTVEDLPQTSFDQRTKPKTSDCRVVLYERAFKMFTQLKEQYDSEVRSRDEASNESQLQLHTIIPVAFEALLFLSTNTYLSNEAAFDEISIQQFLKIAAQVAAPAATYALITNILLAFASGDMKLHPQLDGLRVPLISAARILGQIIQALRSLESYDFEQASRWIRCITQLILDDLDIAFATYQPQGELRCDQSLSMLESVVQQVLGLIAATANLLDASEMEVDTNRLNISSGPYRYPPEELQWLATKLFNLAVDFCAFEMQDMAQKWAGKALEIAGILAADAEGEESGGLADLLQRKMSELGLGTMSNKT